MTRRLALWLAAHAALALVTLVALSPQWGRGLMLYDLGEVAFFVDKVRRLLIPGLDYVVNGYGPGRYLMFAALLRWLELPELVVYQGVFVALRLLLSALIFECGRILLPGRRLPWILLPLLCLWLAPGPLHKGFFMAGTAALLLALLSYLAAPSRARALVYGLVLFVVASLRLDLGAFGALAMLFAASGGRGRMGHLLIAATPLATAVVLGALTLTMRGEGALIAVVTQILDDAAKNQRIVWPRFPGPLELLTAPTLDRALLWLPIPVYGALLLALLRTGRWGFAVAGDERRRLGALLFFGVLTCNQVRMKPEFGHLLQAGPVLYLSVAVLAAHGVGDGVGRGWARARWLALCAALPLLLVANTLGSHRGSIYTGSFTIAGDRSFVLDTPLGRALLNQGEFAELQPLLKFLREEAPPGPLWVPTNQPLLYALSERPDVSGRVGVVYYAEDPALERALIERLERERPPVAVFVDDSIEGPERRLENAAPLVHSYLLTRYQDVVRFGRMRVMLRGDGEPLRP